MSSLPLLIELITGSDLLVQRRKTMLSQAEATLDAVPLQWTDAGHSSRTDPPGSDAAVILASHN